MDAAVVLAGGQSRRMGRDKATLPWGRTTLLGQVSEVLQSAVGGPVFVVHAAGQELPPLPPGVRTVVDPQPDLGPVQGLAAGLAAAADPEAPDDPDRAAFVAATDLPFLHGAVVRRVLSLLDDDHDVAAPVLDGHPQLLAAAYRCAVAPEVASRLAGGERRARTVVAALRVRLLAPADLLADPEVARADPALRSFTNLNHPAAYESALASRRP